MNRRSFAKVILVGIGALATAAPSAILAAVERIGKRRRLAGQVTFRGIPIQMSPTMGGEFRPWPSWTAKYYRPLTPAERNDLIKKMRVKDFPWSPPNEPS